MELWSGIKDTASFAWRAGRLNFILGFSLMMVEPLAMPIAAVGLRGIDFRVGQHCLLDCFAKRSCLSRIGRSRQKNGG